jgi:hypothetical protein
MFRQSNANTVEPQNKPKSPNFCEACGGVVDKSGLHDTCEVCGMNYDKLADNQN